MLKRLSTKTKCDVRDCKNYAVYLFETKGLHGKCFLCEDCLAKLSDESKVRAVPKSPQSAFNKKMRSNGDE